MKAVSVIVVVIALCGCAHKSYTEPKNIGASKKVKTNPLDELVYLAKEMHLKYHIYCFHGSGCNAEAWPREDKNEGHGDRWIGGGDTQEEAVKKLVNLIRNGAEKYDEGEFSADSSTFDSGVIDPTHTKVNRSTK